LKYSSVRAAVAPVPKACRHAGGSVWATRGSFQGLGDVGGANRSGGLLANGMPRYALASPVTEGWFNTLVAVPTTTPESKVTVGLAARASSTGEAEEVATRESRLGIQLVFILVGEKSAARLTIDDWRLKIDLTCWITLIDERRASCYVPSTFHHARLGFQCESFTSLAPRSTTK
jgi:hypothetical protein